MILSIASPAFVEGYKWRFSDGASIFHATIEDKAFLDRVEKGEAFRKGDYLECRIRVVQSQRADGLHTDYYVAEVLRHIPSGVQMSLPGAEGDQPS